MWELVKSSDIVRDFWEWHGIYHTMICERNLNQLLLFCCCFSRGWRRKMADGLYRSRVCRYSRLSSRGAKAQNCPKNIQECSVGGYDHAGPSSSQGRWPACGGGDDGFLLVPRSWSLRILPEIGQALCDFGTEHISESRHYLATAALVQPKHEGILWQLFRFFKMIQG